MILSGMKFCIEPSDSPLARIGSMETQPQGQLKVCHRLATIPISVHCKSASLVYRLSLSGWRFSE